MQTISYRSGPPQKYRAATKTPSLIEPVADGCIAYNTLLIHCG